MSGDGDKDKNKAAKPYEIDYKKVGLSALLGVGGSMLLGASFDGSIDIFGLPVPQAAAFGLVTGLGTLAGEVLMQMPNVTGNSWIALFKAYMEPVLAGASTLALGLVLIDSSMDDYSVLVQQFGLGFGSSLISDWLMKNMPKDGKTTNGSSTGG